MCVLNFRQEDNLSMICNHRIINYTSGTAFRIVRYFTSGHYFGCKRLHQNERRPTAMRYARYSLRSRIYVPTVDSHTQVLRSIDQN